MLRPFLVIGVGGSGGKTLRGLRHALELRLQQADWKGGLPTAWQFLHIDTPTSQDGTDFVLPFLPPSDYHGLIASGATYETVYGSVVHGQRLAADVVDDVKRQLPDSGRVPVTVAKGAGQFRAVGRTVVLSKLADVSAAARRAIDRMTAADALGELETLGERLGAKPRAGATPSPTVIVASSIAGGSGAGQYLDVVEAVKEVAKTHDWAHNIFSMLYAPDVFDQVSGSAGIPSNALGTVAETMAGFWTKAPSRSTLEIFKSRGLQPSYGGARDRVGAAYPFIVGRQNSKVAFPSQGSVYSAVSTSVAAWMTDDKVQGEIDEYAVTNWNANTGANVLPDNSRLMSPLDQTPPFSAIGFGRVTLGREKFLDYAGERFARSVVDQMLYAHIEDDRMLKERTQGEWVDFGASRALEGFIRASGLDEETEDRNDVIDALRALPQIRALGDELNAAIRADINTPGSLDAKTGGLSQGEWVERIISSYSARERSLLEQDRGNRGVKFTEWVDQTPERVLSLVEQYVATVGLSVTVELLRRLSGSVKTAAEQLVSEAETNRGWARRLRGFVNEELAAAPDIAAIRPESDVWLNAVERAVQGLEWQSEAALRESASVLLTEFRTEFLDPLADALTEGRQSLLAHVTEGTRTDGRENDYEQWPTRNSRSVPRKYEPSPNERLLVEHSEYPAEFDRLVAASSLQTRSDDAMFDVMTSLLIGVDGADGEAGMMRRGPRLISYPRSWRPAATAAVGEKTSAQRPRFQFEDDPAEYIVRAKQWMQREGTTFHAYITEDLSTYFDEERVGAGEFKQRKDRFREQLTAALGSSEPLVKLNPGLLSEVHGKAIGDGVRTVFSSIPFAAHSDLYELTKSVLASQGYWDEAQSPGWFKDVKVSSLEIFAMLGYPYQPIVMDSVMAPIAKSWLAESNTQDSRAAFWKWKRSRLLRESAPAAPEVFDQMVRGWYVAKVLGLLEVDDSNQQRGPKLSIWDPQRRSRADFPHPLLSGVEVQPHDFIGVVMESLTVALALSNGAGSLEPLRAYHQLMDLGGRDRQLGIALRGWIEAGRVLDGAPTPGADRAGTSDEGMRARQAKVAEYLLHDERQRFREDVVDQEPGVSVYAYPVSWEIRDTVLSALDALVDAVRELREPRSGV
ncbi:tubulin-like doman-containing protein [Agromyces sp. Marseille-Q5079]|uniref:tubulin-like doman-containing protein n=1 Tax=Agromyces sp. Marseille-Q5079 TaxID=3439059 RepID=UPI003D9CA2D2